MNTPQIKKLIEIKQQLDQVKATKAELESAFAAQQQVVMDQLVEEGVDSVKTEGHTIFMRAQVWAGIQGRPIDLVDALRDQGLPELCSVNHSKLSSWVREQLEDHEKQKPEKGENAREIEKEFLPQSLRPLIRVTEKYGVTVRRS